MKVAYRLMLWIITRVTMCFKKQFAKKDFLRHFTLGHYYIIIQHFPHSNIWRLHIHNLSNSLGCEFWRDEVAFKAKLWQFLKDETYCLSA